MNSDEQKRTIDQRAIDYFRQELVRCARLMLCAEAALARLRYDTDRRDFIRNVRMAFGQVENMAPFMRMVDVKNRNVLLAPDIAERIADRVGLSEIELMKAEDSEDIILAS